MRPHRLLAGLMSFAAMLAWWSVPAQAVTQQEITSCGQTITSDAYLSVDLTCTVGITLDRVGDTSVNVTVDLQGHSLHGLGGGSAFVVDGSPYYDNLHVKNGRVDHWAQAFNISYGALTVTAVRADHNQVALDCNGDCVATASSFSDNLVGTDAHEASLLLTNNSFTGNTIGSRVGGAASSGEYTGNRYTNNATGVSVTPTAALTLTSNAFSGNGVGLRGVGDPNADGYYATVDSNTFVDNTDGIYLLLTGQDGATLHNNKALNNTRYGIYAPRAVDDGGNKSGNNGVGCVGVTCGRITRTSGVPFG